MKRIIFILLTVVVNTLPGRSQDMAVIDSLKSRLIEQTNSERILHMNNIAAIYRFVIPGSIFVYANQALKLSKATNIPAREDYYEKIGSINIIPQDIGRVIINLVTNAFCAVTEKKKQATIKFDPTVIVSTKKLEDKIEIKVADNDNVIPGKIFDKNFQPFFTIKPLDGEQAYVYH